MTRPSTARTSLLALCLVSSATAYCRQHTPAFPSPDYGRHSPELLQAFNAISDSLNSLVASSDYNTSSYSVEITSTRETLWSTYHTAEEKDPSRPGAGEVNGDSAYRIASITKVFTVLGLLYQDVAGNLSLDDSIDTYVTDLKGPQKGTPPWKDITLRTLASQLSGIPRDFAQGDLIFTSEDPAQYGLPPATTSGLPKCDSYNNYTNPCTGEDLINWLRSATPVYAPKQASTYSNLAFELLGLALANVTGQSYEDYIRTSILEPLNMTASSFSKPSDNVAVLPKGEAWYWDVVEGVQNPTGGLFTTSGDLSKFLRYILNHYNGITPSLNWFHPASFTHGINSFYGVPWETFRTDKILPDSRRPVTFITKGGGLPGYSTNILLVPEYSLGITLLTAGNTLLLEKAREIITTHLIRAADKVAERQAREKYAGTYSSRHINSTITISLSPTHGLYVSQFISNGTDPLPGLRELAHLQGMDFTLQLIPTLLYRDEKHKRGELFRAVLDTSSPSRGPPEVWDDFCVTNVDVISYARRPVGEVVFWDTNKSGTRFERIELTAFRIWLDRDADSENSDAAMLSDQAR